MLSNKNNLFRLQLDQSHVVDSCFGGVIFKYLLFSWVCYSAKFHYCGSCPIHIAWSYECSRSYSFHWPMFLRIFCSALSSLFFTHFFSSSAGLHPLFRDFLGQVFANVKGS
ncbi:hypothetical protein Y032_0008g240 [Ancylostoma ceylanicum]|uniref:Uncharacterized protein n=1 Tax=Ancylostoma ceylanicum TaxID=53326 RepID=A0A016VKS5_9BILA|nr:hypothetical protein Y032_0008g240 [Ancylostoma ceylanicum]